MLQSCSKYVKQIYEIKLYHPSSKRKLNLLVLCHSGSDFGFNVNVCWTAVTIQLVIITEKCSKLSMRGVQHIHRVDC